MACKVVYKDGHKVIECTRAKLKAKSVVILRSGEEKFTNLDKKDFEAMAEDYPVTISDTEKMTITADFVKKFLRFKQEL